MSTLKLIITGALALLAGVANAGDWGLGYHGRGYEYRPYNPCTARGSYCSTRPGPTEVCGEPFWDGTQWMYRCAIRRYAPEPTYRHTPEHYPGQYPGHYPRGEVIFSPVPGVTVVVPLDGNRHRHYGW